MVNKTLARRESLFNKVINSNLDITQLKQLDKKQWNNVLGTKVKTNESLKAQKRLLDQIKSDIDDVSTRYIIKKNIKNKNIQISIKTEAKKRFKVIKVAKPMKTVQKKLLPLKEGSYITTVIYTNDGDKFISSSSRKDFLKQLAILDSAYGVISIGKSGRVKPRKAYITDAMRERFKKDGMKLPKNR